MQLGLQAQELPQVTEGELYMGHGWTIAGLKSYLGLLLEHADNVGSQT